MGLLAKASVAIDGSKFKAVNNRDRNFTRGKIDRRRAQLEESVARYLSQLDTAYRQEPSDVLVLKTTRLKEKLDKLKEEMGKLAAYQKQMLASPDGQISLTDSDSRSMATSGRGSGVVGYNVQVAVDAVNHLIVTHEVTNTGSDRSQLANVAREAKAVLQVDKLEAAADSGYFNGEEILACEQAGICVTLPKPMTSGAKSEGRFGKQDFVYMPEEDVYRCPAGEKLMFHYANEEHGQKMRRYWTNACKTCAIKEQCITRWGSTLTLWGSAAASGRRISSGPSPWPRKSIRARSGSTGISTCSPTFPSGATSSPASEPNWAALAWRNILSPGSSIWPSSRPDAQSRRLRDGGASIPEFRSAENAIDAGLLFAPSGVALGHGVVRPASIRQQCRAGTLRPLRPKLNGTNESMKRREHQMSLCLAL